MARRSPKKLTPIQKGGRAVKQYWWLIAGAVIALVFVGVIISFIGAVPLPQAAKGAQSSKILAADGQLIGTLHGEQNRSIVPLDQISPYLRNAVIAAEDRGFYTHPGVSLKGILRAAFANFAGGGVRQGGSTITQQYVRNAFAQVGRERTFFRKIKEVTLAVKLERKYSKNKILEFYLNTVYFGRGAYGCEAAARTYFKKPAKDLTLGQSAYLAGIIRSPQRFQIDQVKTAATGIRDLVVGEMQDAGSIQPAEAAAAKKEDLAADFRPGASVEFDSPKGAYFVEYVRRRLGYEFHLNDGEILGGGLTIQTTLDMRMQDAAESAVSSVLNKPDDPEAALVAMDPQGMVKAMVGGRDVKNFARARGTNFAANFRDTDTGGRQPGSAFKPFALAAMVDEGKSINSQFPGPAKITISSPRCRNADGTPWEVNNFEKESFGLIDITTATVNSVNTVYAQMMDKVVTPAKFVSIAGKAGITIPRSDSGCALALGTSDVTPFEMARGYTTFATRGKRPDPLTILKITAPDGKVIAEKKPKLERALDQNVSDTVSYVLKENIKRGTGKDAQIGRPAAGKTGTTEKYANAWFAGYTPELTAVVWMGFPPDPTGRIPEMTNVHGRKVNGGSFPAAIWKKFMAEATKGLKATDFVQPQITGEVISPAPTPCPPAPSPDPNSPADRSNCLPSPKPSPSPSPLETPGPEITRVPSPLIPTPFIPSIPPVNLGPAISPSPNPKRTSTSSPPP